MKTYLVYIELGGDMECPECFYIAHEVCRGNTREEVLKDYQQHFKYDISNGTIYGRKIKMVEIPTQANGCWNDIKIIEEVNDMDK